MELNSDKYNISANLIKILIESASAEKDFTLLLESLRGSAEFSDDLHATLLSSLCGLEFPEAEAKQYVDDVLDNKARMEVRLERPVSFHVALLDHLMKNGQRIACPKITDLKTFEERTKLIMVDELTGLYNRRYVDSILSREIDRAKRFNLQLSVLFTDLDNFKQVNDNHGHHTGDEVLKQYSAILEESLRTHDVAARYGGEEFIVVLPETADTGAKIYGDRLLEKCRHHAFPMGLNISFSGGIACYPNHGSTATSIIEQADIGLYYSKAKGKNQITILENNKRNAVRYPTVLDVRYITNQSHLEGKTKNVSISGLSFMGSAPIQVGETIQLHLQLPATDKVFEVGAQIVWVRKIQPKMDYFLGAKFTNLKPEIINLVDKTGLPA
ncbi:MAG: diguanylate cyclase [Spirochaetales bacterium]|nr:MAG: diguanylate cyclase [Spirochaetales bacterium]